MNQLDLNKVIWKERNQELWYRSTSPLLQLIIHLAGYSSSTEASHLAFYKAIVCSSFGPHPASDPARPVFKSYMNDDHTPIELSWSWKKGTRLPKVRYSIEPIGEFAGTSRDPGNIKAPDDFVRNLRENSVDIDFHLYDHFSAAFAAPSNISHGIAPLADASSKFVALELKQTGDLSVKAYFMPPSHQDGQFQSMLNAIRSLSLTDAPLLRTLSRLSTFLSTTIAISKVQAPMLAIDCIDPSQARIKFYIRTPSTSFDTVLRMMDLPDHSLSPRSRSTLRDLYRTVLGLSDDVEDSDDLPETNHRTAGMIYHYDLRLASDKIKMKLYIPVKHYGTNDLQVARNFSAWMEQHGWGLQGSSYLEALERMCTHRKLVDGLGYQTYLSATFNGDDVAVTAYLQPEMYHPLRKWH